MPTKPGRAAVRDARIEPPSRKDAKDRRHLNASAADPNAGTGPENLVPGRLGGEKSLRTPTARPYSAD
jgi:hypothetical protein